MSFTDPGLDAIFSALAHPIRRALIVRLERGPATVGDLAKPFDVSLMAISKHLSVLERAELVRRAPEGRYTRCTLQPAPLVEASAWLADHSRFWASQFTSLGEYLERSSEKEPSP
jgi:DNA-binding transcriptional ArsR family regulator